MYTNIIQVYKSFGSETDELTNRDIDTTNLSLMKISDVYEKLGNKTLIFLDIKGNEIRVKSITKQTYNGKIYDVDVPNDIVLVKRGNSSAIWSGNSNNGSKQGNAVQTDSGKFGKGFSFDGAGDYVSTSSDSIGTGDDSVSVWIYAKTGGVSARVIDNNKFLFWLKTSNLIALTSDGGTTYVTSATSSIPYNQWNHVVAVRNSSGYGWIYVNGVLSGTAGATGTSAGGSWNITIGDRPAGDRSFNGTIDEVMIFNRSLSASEIASLYNATRLQFTQTGLGEGSHTYTAYTQDLAANINSSSLTSFSVDSVFPQVNFTSPTPNNASTQASNSVYVNITSSDTNQHFVVNNLDNSLVSWWRMDDLNSSGDVVDYMGCYDNETKILTREEVECSFVDCNDEGVICEDNHEEVINVNPENDGLADLSTENNKKLINSNGNQIGYNNELVNNNLNSQGSASLERVGGIVGCDRDYGEDNWKLMNNNNQDADNKKENEGINQVPQRLEYIFADYDNYSYNNYLNVSSVEALRTNYLILLK